MQYIVLVLKEKLRQTYYKITVKLLAKQKVNQSINKHYNQNTHLKEEGSEYYHWFHNVKMINTTS